MPTDKPSIEVLLDKETNGLLATLADEKNRSISVTAADLIREALELYEDRALSEISNERIASDNGKRYSHDDAWGDK
ncbi:ribbon-helix-helix domain-containing protein [Seonamhaeicola marinus]|uniref:Antitoxin, RHH family protein n=1 Tax=Seonamhaeicola marinus TaxID=1912246 RepID=A0A5D0HUB2_9FLAO|nr:antitoxin, RHH family protein [Seonamhaeicola marinus]TYA74905.1 antitoxin, RHH family protein [Seonamhaeicola marinus]